MSQMTSAAHAADTDYLVRQAMNTGYQWCSLLVPPLYITYVVGRRGRTNLSLNGILRATWISGLGGAGLSGGGAYARYAYSSEDAVRLKRVETAYNTDIMRRNDHSTVGAILVAVLTPAILWKRANVANLILGGAGLGSGIGLLTHYARSVSGDTPPIVVLPVTPE